EKILNDHSLKKQSIKSSTKEALKLFEDLLDRQLLQFFKQHDKLISASQTYKKRRQEIQQYLLNSLEIADELDIYMPFYYINKPEKPIDQEIICDYKPLEELIKTTFIEENNNDKLKQYILKNGKMNPFNHFN